jgi:hypothetical protein
MSATSKKVKALTESNEDFEWYPTTEEILRAVNEDLHALFAKGNLANDDSYRKSWNGRLFDSRWKTDRNSDKDIRTYCVKTFLDVGAGDGRVFDAIRGKNGDIEVEKRYGIEIAQAQADDLIRRDVFIIGRDFFKTSLIDKACSVIFSNPPYSQFVPWAEKLLAEANFGVMYLVLPVRWRQSLGKQPALALYEAKTLGEFDFLLADRAARARVNLIRVTRKKVRVKDRYGTHIEYGADSEPDSFERWIDEHLGTFNTDAPEAEEERALKLKQGGISDLVESYDYEMAALLDAFKAIGRMPSRVIEALGMSRKSMQEIIRGNIKSLKRRHWRAAFDKLSPINSRLTKDTRRAMLAEMEEFSTLDFNEDNVYSIVVWVINHFNKHTAEQILSVFDALASPDYIKAYKSNAHWTQDDWRYTKTQGKPEKYRLDYRLVTRCHVNYRYEESVLDDLIVICRSLGFYIAEHARPDYEPDGREQTFHTTEGEIAFTARLYKNRNAHLKISEELMLKFNVEVGKLRRWINAPKDIADEFDVSEAEATKLWQSSNLRLLGKSDIGLLGFDGTATEKSA